MRPFLIAFVVVLLSALALPVSASAPSTPAPSPTTSGDPLDQQLQDELAQQAALAATKAELGSEVQAANDQQNALAQLIDANQTAIQQTMDKLAAAEQEYNDASNREATDHAAAVAARQKVADDKALLGMLMKQSYTHQDTFVAYVLQSSSFSQMLSRAADLAHLQGRSSDLVTEIQQQEQAAEDAEAAAKADADQAQQAAAQLSQQQQDLQQQTQHAQDLVQQLGEQAKQAKQEISAANSQSLAVAQQIAQTKIEQIDATIAEAEQAAWQEAEYYVQNNLGNLPPGLTAPPTGTINPDGSQFVWPTHGAQISQGFGPSPYPFEPAYGGFPHFHTGIDMSAPTGTPILAAADGVVVAATSSDVGYGNHIIIAHVGQLMTLYGHLQVMLVKPGDSVKQGQMIGLMGSTGNSTGSHLHFEVRDNNNPVDPRPFLPALPPGATGP